MRGHSTPWRYAHTGAATHATYLSSELSIYSIMIRVDDSYRVASARRIAVGSEISILTVVGGADEDAGRHGWRYA